MSKRFWKKDKPDEKAPLERKIYRHAKGYNPGSLDESLYSGELSAPALEREQIIPYQGRNLLLFENLSCGHAGVDKYVIVPGFIVGEPKKYDPYKSVSVKRETMISLVELIKDDDTRNKVRSFLERKGLGKGYDISFW